MTVRRRSAAGALAILLTACATGNLSRPAVGPGPSPGSEPVDSLVLATASAIVRSEAALASVWPGYWPRGQGFIIARPRGDVLLVSRVAPDSGFERVDGRSLTRALRGRAFVHRGTIDGLYSSGNDHGYDIHYSVAGTSVPAVAVKDSVRTAAETLFHEAFHGFQDDHFVTTPGRGESSPGLSAKPPPEFDAMAEVERRILAEALSAEDTDTRALLRSFHAVRSRRFSSTPDTDRTEELRLERIEGSAQLAGVQASLVVTGVDGRQADRLVRGILTVVLVQADPSWHTRLRVYGSGAGTGLLLDRLGVPWRGELARGATFADILTSAFPIEPAEEASLADAALARFGYQQLLEKESAASRPPRP